MCLPGNPICILNSNKWRLTSKCSVKGTGKTLEERVRKSRPLCLSTDRKQQHCATRVQPDIKNSGKIDLLLWAQSYNYRRRGKYFNFTSVVFENKHPLFQPNKMHNMKNCTQFGLKAEELSRWRQQTNSSVVHHTTFLILQIITFIVHPHCYLWGKKVFRSTLKSSRI